MADDVGIKDGNDASVTIAAKDIGGVLHPIHLIGDSTTGDPIDTSLPSEVVGSVASGSADSGKPVKIGGVFNSTLPTVTTGQRVDLQTDAKGNLRTYTVLGAQAGADGVSNSNIGWAQNTLSSSAALLQAIAPHIFNGSSWDRARKPNGTSRVPSSAASTNATVAKASAGDLHVVAGNNASGAVRYLKFYNKATSPTVGTDTPVMTLPLPTGAFSFNFYGHYFSAGISFALTTGAADSDTTAVASGDVLGLTATYA